MIKRFVSCAVLTALLLLLLCPCVSATKIIGGQPVKLDITGSGYNSFGFLTDGNIGTYRTSADSCSITLTSKESFGSLYLMFDLEYGQYTITDNVTGQSQIAGQHSMLHEYVEQ